MPSIAKLKQESRKVFKQIATDSNYAYGFFTVHVPAGKLERFPDGGTGYACVMLKRPPKNSKDTSYTASFSFCSPLDAPKTRQLLNKHFKAKSKRIAATRMANMRVKSAVDLTLTKNENTKLPDLFKQALDAACKMQRPDKPNLNMVPSWVTESDKIEYGLNITDNP